MAMIISRVARVNPSHPYLENAPASSFAPNFCAFHLGFSLVTGEFRPRPNTMIEMGRVLAQNPSLVCVLKEDKVEMPSDYSGLITELLDNWQSVLQRELREAGLL